jgi:phage-related minor tail protein
MKSIGGFADGGAFSGGQSVSVNATGNVFDKPTMFSGNGRLNVMGEAGPEAVMPLKRLGNGRLGIESNGSQGGNNTVINNNMSVTIGSVNSDEEKQQLMKAMRDQMIATAKQTMSNEMRQGGMLNRRVAA